MIQYMSSTQKAEGKKFPLKGIHLWRCDFWVPPGRRKEEKGILKVSSGDVTNSEFLPDGGRKKMATLRYQLVVLYFSSSSWKEEGKKFILVCKWLLWLHSGFINGEMTDEVVPKPGNECARMFLTILWWGFIFICIFLIIAGNFY